MLVCTCISISNSHIGVILIYAVQCDTSYSPEQGGSLPYPAELDAEGLNFDEQLLDVDDFVSDEGLKEDAQQTHQPVLPKSPFV